MRVQLLVWRNGSKAESLRGFLVQRGSGAEKVTFHLSEVLKPVWRAPTGPLEPGEIPREELNWEPSDRGEALFYNFRKVEEVPSGARYENDSGLKILVTNLEQHPPKVS